MKLEFRKLPASQPPVPVSGEIVLWSAAADSRGRRQLALLALDQGLAAFVHGEGRCERIVIQAEPTLDDMLAALFVEQLAQEQPLPAGARALATYAALVREGLRPSELPLKDSVEGIFLAIRTAAGLDLTQETPQVKFLASWSEMARRLSQAAETGLDPRTQPLFANDLAFARDRTFLEHDREVYRQQDVPAGERWLIRVPGGPPHELAGLLLRSPRSVLWKYWAREDRDAPGGMGYVFLTVSFQSRQWTFSTDPVQRLPIKPLADALQTAESARNAVQAAQDPWYDGRHHEHTIVGAPHGGTRLADPEVLAIVRRWLSAQPVNGKRWRLPVGHAVSAAAAVLLGGVLVWFLAGLSSSGSPTGRDTPVLAQNGTVPSTRQSPGALPASYQLNWSINGQKQARALVRVQAERGQDEPEQTVAWVKLDLEPGKYIVGFDAVGPESRAVRLGLALRSEQELTLADLAVEVNEIEKYQLTLPPSRKAWTSEALPGFFGSKKNRIDVHLRNTGAAPLPVTIELRWQRDPTFKPTVHLLAVGVTKYQRAKYNLTHADQDAGALVAAWQRNSLFGKVIPHPLLNEKASKSNILGELRRLRDQARQKDLVIVTLSGHGMKHEGGRFFFLPHDYDPDQEPALTALSWNDFFDDYFKLIPCPVLVVLDACHSGAAALPGARGATSEEVDLALNEALKKFESQLKDGIVILAASRGEQQAFEGNWGHGALTLAVLEVLGGRRLYTNKAETPLPRATPAGIITLDTLVNYAKLRVQEITGAKQNVVVKADGIHLEDFPIVWRPPDK